MYITHDAFSVPDLPWDIFGLAPVSQVSEDSKFYPRVSQARTHN